ncbi:Imm49 family immunity protein [Corallococcus macrosporus]|uniref:Uncharacterized protein n=1 Tax=Myxococcus fulvus (strain ATCC BAA-855 / HW-1) TaxID=483219 RepID=F8CFT7_MYXFH|nr:Imm49 family immunity protein [Corallococcus macrosporus]AEI64906.1 hypothetical protein LILAB_15005 [Corallococcus macrosporus]
MFVTNALEENEELLPSVTLGTASLRDVLRFCQGFRIAGIGSLLSTGSATHFHLYLHKSARAFIHHLRQVGTTAWMASKAAPFFDAVACGDDEAALELARLAPTAADRKGEFPEDFFYARFLMNSVLPDMTPQQASALLDSYERALEGAADSRLDACRALLTGNEEALNVALTQMMEERDSRYQKLAEKEVLAEELLATEAYISVEGLALTRLATLKGMSLPEEHLFIPSTARAPRSQNFQSDDWRQMWP